uniref:Uncharacterized protein n=1 Tax=viral metagenome TaxID=1070528 RepID=A0A6M3JV73_9ZZZZ
MVKLYIKEIGNCLQCPYYHTVMSAPARDYCNKADKYIEISWHTVDFDYFPFPEWCPLPFTRKDIATM